MSVDSCASDAKARKMSREVEDEILQETPQRQIRAQVDVEFTACLSAGTPPQPFATIPFSRDPDLVDRGDILEQLRRRCSLDWICCSVSPSRAEVASFSMMMGFEDQARDGDPLLLPTAQAEATRSNLGVVPFAEAYDAVVRRAAGLVDLLNELLTPTLKLKRPQTARAFRSEIGRMYAEINSQPGAKAKL
ncbi:hypothetical protein GGTG_13807 [Gaeumannomyces tritici R3-111a-1]|uniref:Uncharacterized protein n=1 Tax=Gaeumannomyces tritici (strain R3-111a-1) TaxID=644352 RepID=J3PJW6_GAET3|nr:hypothetical protein GGTG_13807 [Gaeumannomyces tritici R3-111a-1]EJT68617.1 hypothetical protein GGTG_13807 [Gaeumannomyces tritici R3-111a-1]